MAIPNIVLDHLKQLDDRYDKRWEELPDTHPDIVKLHQISILLDGGEKPKSGRVGKQWTDDEIAFVKANHSTMSDEQMAIALGTTKHIVSHRRLKMGLTAYNRKNNPKVVIQCDMLGNPIRRFESINKAAEYMGSSDRSISLVCTGKRPSFRGHIWRYEDES